MQIYTVCLFMHCSVQTDTLQRAVTSPTSNTFGMSRNTDCELDLITDALVNGGKSLQPVQHLVERQWRLFEQHINACAIL